MKFTSDINNNISDTLPSPASYASMAEDSQGFIHVTWVGTDDVNSPSYNQVHYATNKSGHWVTTQTPALESGSAQGEPHIAIDSNDKVHIVWFGVHVAVGGANVIHHLSDETGDWVHTPNIGPDTVQREYPRIAVDSVGDLHVVCMGPGISGQQSINHIKRESGTWQTPNICEQDAALFGYTKYRPSLAIDSNDKVHVAFTSATSESSGNLWLHVASDASGSWGLASYNLSQGYYARSSAMYAVYGGRPEIAINSSDETYITWSGYSPGYPTIQKMNYRYRSSLGGGWSNPVWACNPNKHGGYGEDVAGIGFIEGNRPAFFTFCPDVSSPTKLAHAVIHDGSALFTVRDLGQMQTRWEDDPLDSAYNPIHANCIARADGSLAAVYTAPTQDSTVYQIHYGHSHMTEQEFLDEFATAYGKTCARIGYNGMGRSNIKATAHYNNDSLYEIQNCFGESGYFLSPQYYDHGSLNIDLDLGQVVKYIKEIQFGSAQSPSAQPSKIDVYKSADGINWDFVENIDRYAGNNTSLVGGSGVYTGPVFDLTDSIDTRFLRINVRDNRHTTNAYRYILIQDIMIRQDKANKARDTAPAVYAGGAMNMARLGMNDLIEGSFLGSTYYSGSYKAHEAFNTSHGSTDYWRLVNNTGRCQIDFGSKPVVPIRGLSMAPRQLNAGSYGNRMPGMIQVSGSDDNTNWDLIDLWINTTHGVFTRWFPAASNYRYLKIEVMSRVDGSTTSCYVGLIEILEQPHITLQGEHGSISDLGSNGLGNGSYHAKTTGSGMVQNLFDGTETSSWQPTSTTGQWVSIDMGTVINTYGVVLKNATGNGSDMPATVDFQISSDNAVWETVQSFTCTEDDEQILLLDASVNTQYVRLFMDGEARAVPVGTFKIATVSLLGGSEETLTASGKNGNIALLDTNGLSVDDFTGNDYNGGYPPENAFDGWAYDTPISRDRTPSKQGQGFMYQTSVTGSQYVQVRFGQVIGFTGFRVYAPNWPSHSPKDVKIEVSMDGVSWKDAGSYTLKEPRTAQQPMDYNDIALNQTLNGRFFRMTVLNNHGGTQFRLEFMEIFGGNPVVEPYQIVRKEVLGFADYQQSNPTVVIDKEGVEHAVWQGATPTNPAEDRVHYATDNGEGVWVVEEDIFDSLGDSGLANPDIAVGDDGTIHVVADGTTSGAATEAQADFESGIIASSSVSQAVTKENTPAMVRLTDRKFIQVGGGFGSTVNVFNVVVANDGSVSHSLFNFTNRNWFDTQNAIRLDDDHALTVMQDASNSKWYAHVLKHQTEGETPSFAGYVELTYSGSGHRSLVEIAGRIYVVGYSNAGVQSSDTSLEELTWDGTTIATLGILNDDIGSQILSYPRRRYSVVGDNIVGLVSIGSSDNVHCQVIRTDGAGNYVSVTEDQLFDVAVELTSNDVGKMTNVFAITDDLCVGIVTTTDDTLNNTAGWNGRAFAFLIEITAGGIIEHQQIELNDSAAGYFTESPNSDNFCLVDSDTILCFEERLHDPTGSWDTAFSTITVDAVGKTMTLNRNVHLPGYDAWSLNVVNVKPGRVLTSAMQADSGYGGFKTYDATVIPGSPGGSTSRQIHYCQKAPQMTWQTTENISNISGFDQAKAKLAIDFKNHLHCAWQGDRGISQGECISYSTFDGVSWGATERVDNVQFDQFDPAIAVDAQGVPFVAWSGKTMNEGLQKINRADKKRGFWYRFLNCAHLQGSEQTQPKIALDRKGHPHLCWVDKNGNGPKQIHYGHTRQTAFVKDLDISGAGAADQTDPTLVVDEDGKAHVSWDGIETSSGGVKQVHYATNRGGSWGRNYNLSNETSNHQLKPSLQMSAPTQPVVLWQGQTASGSNPQINEYRPEPILINVELVGNALVLTWDHLENVEIFAGGDTYFAVSDDGRQSYDAIDGGPRVPVASDRAAKHGGSDGQWGHDDNGSWVTTDADEFTALRNALAKRQNKFIERGREVYKRSQLSVSPGQQLHLAILGDSEAAALSQGVTKVDYWPKGNWEKVKTELLEAEGVADTGAHNIKVYMSTETDGNGDQIARILIAAGQ